ncbi:MAG TPA: ABC transporter permease [Acidimicrobiales bacterium]|nr:ABC transporter permease [Acidimicrobiales bacterium]
MTHFLSFAIPGIPFGFVYALVAVGLVLTYKTSGVFNLAFAAQAYVSAAIFYAAVSQHHWSKWAGFVLAVVVAGPALGYLLDRFLFRHMRTAPTVVKLISGLGLLIGVPSIVQFFWPGQHQNPPSLSPKPNAVYHFGSYHIDGNQLVVIVAVLVVMAALGLLFKFTALGLKMRAVVESPRMVELAGINSSRISSFAWMLSSFLAALAGVLLAPYYANVDPLNFISLLVAAIAAAVFAGLASLPLALAGGLLLGIFQQVLTGYLPLNSILATGLRPSFPFVVLVLLLLFWPPVRRRREAADPLAGCDPPPPALAASLRGATLDRLTKIIFPVFIVVYMVVSLFLVPTHWLFLLTQGIVYATIFLSITALTGMSGQISLCQASFAGIGAFTAGQLATQFNINFIVGMIIGGVVAGAAGALVAIPTLRLRGLYLALATLAFALLASNVLFPQSWLGNGDTGVSVPRPGGFSGNRAFFLLAMAVFAICAVIVILVRKGTIGRYLAALRGSEVAAETIGINPVRAKITIFALSAGIAGVGGAMFGSLQGTTSAGDYNAFFSLLFVVLVLTTGVRTVEGAVNAGIAFVVVPELLGNLGSRFTVLAFFLFGIGALTYARHPEGAVEYNKRRSLLRISAWLDRRAGREPTTASFDRRTLAAPDVPTRELGDDGKVEPDVAGSRPRGGS